MAPRRFGRPAIRPVRATPVFAVLLVLLTACGTDRPAAPADATGGTGSATATSGTPTKQAAAVQPSPATSADNTVGFLRYLNDIASVDQIHPQEDVQLGQQVCVAAARKSLAADIAAGLVKTGYTAEQAHILVSSAIQDLCPQNGPAA